MILSRSHIKLNGPEREVIELLCKGIAPKELKDHIASLHNLKNRRAVHYYIRRVKDKLGARTTWQACAIWGALHPGTADEIHPSVVDVPYPKQREQ